MTRRSTKTLRKRAPGKARSRAGLASLDYVLILGVILPMVLVIMRDGRRAIQLVYDMVSVLVSWPFM